MGGKVVNVKIVTFSLFPEIIKKLEDLVKFKHLPNKSKILSQLVEAEHRKYLQAKELSSDPA